MATLQTHWCPTETWSWTYIICRQAPKSLNFEVSRERRGQVEEGRDSLTGGGALPEHSAPPSWAVLSKPSAPPAQLLHAHCGQGPSEGGAGRTKHASAPLWAPSGPPHCSSQDPLSQLQNLAGWRAGSVQTWRLRGTVTATGRRAASIRRPVSTGRDGCSPRAQRRGEGTRSFLFSRCKAVIGEEAQGSTGDGIDATRCATWASRPDIRIRDVCERNNRFQFRDHCTVH